MTLKDCLEQLQALPSAFPVKDNAEIVVSMFGQLRDEPREFDFTIQGVTFDEQTERVIILAFNCFQPIRSNAMADQTKATALKAALDATPVDQAVDTFFAWLEAQTQAKITNPLLATFAVEGLKIANSLIDSILARYGI